MPSEKFRITTNGQSLRNPNNGFFGMTLSANMTLDESDTSAHNDRRSAHNALERQRREHLNVKFQQLAHALPALSTVRRPSKTMIVAKSLEFVSSSLKRETTFMSEIQKLRLENEKLRKQAEASSTQLKKQIDHDQPTYVKKRKADSQEEQQQISPPTTPEQQQQRKKKMLLKQSKSPLAAKSEQPSPWTPLLDNPANSYPTSSPPSYFDTTYTTSPNTQNNLFMTPHVDLYDNSMPTIGVQSQYNLMNPMLLSPYFMSTTNESTTDACYYQNHTENFYLS